MSLHLNMYKQPYDEIWTKTKGRAANSPSCTWLRTAKPQNFIRKRETFFIYCTQCPPFQSLYAHKTILWPISKVFEQTFHGVWGTSKPFIHITAYSYDDFKEFLTYFYIEKCRISRENVVAIVDLSEYYHVESLKEKCDSFLSKMEINVAVDTIAWYEFAQLYSLKLATRYFLDLLRSNICDLIYHESFGSAKKDTIKAIVSSRWLNISEELLFDAVSGF